MKKKTSQVILASSIIIAFAAIYISRTAEPLQLQQIEASHVLVDSTYDVSESEYAEYLAPIKDELNATMSTVLGVAAESMRGHAPESLLSNWTSDVILHAANEFYAEPVQIAIMNMGGLRCEIPQGDITMWKMFELMPFDNELVVLTLKGKNVEELCHSFAQQGGQGVAGLRFQINNDRAQHILVDGKPLDVNAHYNIATSNYLAEGNDGMKKLTLATNKVSTGVKLRDVFVNFIKEETLQGREIKSQLDGRISVVQ